MLLSLLIGCAGCLSETTVNQEVIAAACEKLISCRDAEDDVDDFLDHNDWDDFDGCTDGLDDTYETQLDCMEDECDFDAAKAAQCVDALRWAACDDVEDFLDKRDIDDFRGCDDIWDCGDDYHLCLSGQSAGWDTGF